MQSVASDIPQISTHRGLSTGNPVPPAIHSSTHPPTPLVLCEHPTCAKDGMFRMKSVVGSMYKSAPLPTTNFGCTIGCLRAAGAADDTVAAFAAPSSLSTCMCDRWWWLCAQRGAILCDGWRAGSPSPQRRSWACQRPCRCPQQRHLPPAPSVRVRTCIELSRRIDFMLQGGRCYL